jgi:hypothetical protein
MTSIHAHDIGVHKERQQIQILTPSETIFAFSEYFDGKSLAPKLVLYSVYRALSSSMDFVA